MPHPKWRIVTNAMRNDILSGRLGHADLFPNVKTLSLRYGANFRTMRKALYQLYQEGLLVLDKRHYKVATPAATKRKSRIALITFVDSVPEPFATMPTRSHELLRELETHCFSRNLAIDFIFCYYEGATLRLNIDIKKLASQGKRPYSLGLSFWRTGLSDAQTSFVSRSIETLGLSVSVLDDSDISRPAIYTPVLWAL